MMLNDREEISNREHQAEIRNLQKQTDNIKEVTAELLRLTNPLQNEIHNLQEQTGSIKNSSEKLLKIARPGVWLVEDYEKLLKAIGKVIDHATGRDGDLLIMNLSASFGYYLTYDADTVLKDRHENITQEHIDDRNNALKNISCAKYYKHHQVLQMEQKENDAKLYKCALGHGNNHKPSSGQSGTCRVSYLTLDPADGSESAPYRKEYLDPSLIAAEVYYFDPKSTENVHDYFNSTNVSIDKTKKLFLVPKEAHDDLRDDHTLMFKSHLTKVQTCDIQQLEKSGVFVNALQTIPFQMFLSIPKNETKKGLGVFMFLNQYTLSTTNYIAAFGTNDRELLNTFKTMFTAVKNASNKTATSTQIDV
jgi:hypothetical protein